MGLCYEMYDVPTSTDVCYRALLTDHPNTPWARELLRARADALSVERRTWGGAADTYLQIAGLAHTGHDACEARLAAAGIMLKMGQFARAHETISQALQRADTAGDRALARQFGKYALFHEMCAGERAGVRAVH